MIYRVHRASRFWRCMGCYKTIQPGEKYSVEVTPPPVRGGKGWRRKKLCKRCRKIPHANQ